MNNIIVTIPIIIIASAVGVALASQVTPSYLDINSALKLGGVFVMTLEGDVSVIPERQADGTIIFWAWKIPSTGTESMRVVTAMLHDGVNASTLEGFHPHVAKFDSNSCLIQIENISSDIAARENVITIALNENYENFAMTGIIGARSDCTETGLGITLQADHT